ncbi:MAG: hypothetical protein IIB65_06675 [Proteobacteria bacterium]|nr:hypothetical protein [Pseudomonadota bacterium]
MAAPKTVSSTPAITFQQNGVVLGAGDTQVSGIPIQGGGSFPGRVQTLPLTLSWSYSFDGTTWHNANSTGPHKVYLVHATPLEAPLYDFALQKACGYAAGNSDVAGKINQGIAGDLVYDPTQPRSGHVLGFYALGSCQCNNNADLMRYLCRSVGIGADVIYIWGGTAPDQVLFFDMAGWKGPSFQVLAPVNGGAPLNPHFTFHAETVAGGSTYDPSYGHVGLITLEEKAPGAARQTGSAFPPAGRFLSSWVCPH